MKIKKFKLSLPGMLLAFFCVMALPAVAQEESDASGDLEEILERLTSEKTREPFWQCSAPGGTFLVALENISSVSVHEYLLEGVRVVEATVGTSGSLIARYYYIDSPGENTSLATVNRGVKRIKELTQQAQERLTGSNADPHEQAMKTFPDTTHAHTVEYRLDHEELVQAVFKSAREAWVRGEGGKVTIAGGN
jgi:hypothetical protein